MILCSKTHKKKTNSCTRKDTYLCTKTYNKKNRYLYTESHLICKWHCSKTLEFVIDSVVLFDLDKQLMIINSLSD